MTDPTTYAGWIELWEDGYDTIIGMSGLENAKKFAEEQLALEANDCNRSRLEVLTRLIERKKSGL